MKSLTAWNDHILSVSKDALKFSLRGVFNSGVNFFHWGGFAKSAGQIDNRDIRSGHTESHTDELSDDVDNTSEGGGSDGNLNFSFLVFVD